MDHAKSPSPVLSTFAKASAEETDILSPDLGQEGGKGRQVHG